jgi:hypothetical protein
VVTDEGTDAVVVDAFDRIPTKSKTKLVSSTCGAILQVRDEDDTPVREFVPGALRGCACRNPR